MSEKSDQEQRDEIGRFRAGGRGGPGRKPNGVAAAIRRLVDPDVIAKFVNEILTDDRGRYTTGDRMWAAKFVADRIDGKPIATSHVQMSGSTGVVHVAAPTVLTDSPERLAMLADVRRRLRAALSDDPAELPEPELEAIDTEATDKRETPQLAAAAIEPPDVSAEPADDMAELEAIAEPLEPEELWSEPVPQETESTWLTAPPERLAAKAPATATAPRGGAPWLSSIVASLRKPKSAI